MVSAIWDSVTPHRGPRINLVNLAVVSCANGLGHLKRVVRLVITLIDRLHVESLTLFCEPEDSKQIENWDKYFRLKERRNFTLVPVQLPMKWSPEADFYGEWLTSWHTVMSSWRLKNFDAVLSDNLVEPLFYSNHVVLSGSFFWHDVLSEAYGKNPDVEKYARQCREVLASSQPHIIANRYFVTPAVCAQGNVHKIGLIHFSKVNESRSTASRRKRAVIALGGANAAPDLISQLTRAIQALNQNGVEVFAPEGLCQILAKEGTPVQAFDFWADEFDGMDLAIVRGGLGTISDCVASRLPMLFVNDPKPEIQFNQQRVQQLGIGLALDRVSDGSLDFSRNTELFRRMSENMAGLDLNGEVEGSRVLANLWRRKSSRVPDKKFSIR